MAAQEAPATTQPLLEPIQEHASERSLLEGDRQRAGLSAAASSHLQRTSSLLGAISEDECMEDAHVESHDAEFDTIEEERSAGLDSRPSGWYMLGQPPLQEGHHSAKARRHMKALSSEFKINAVCAAERKLNSAARKLIITDSTAHDGGYSAPDFQEEARWKTSAGQMSPQRAASPVAAHTALAAAKEKQLHQIPGSASPECTCHGELTRARLVASRSFGRLRPPSLVNLHAAGDADDAAAIALMSGGRTLDLPCH
jgi:hypothetical protein